jgi:hypothetical protein
MRSNLNKPVLSATVFNFGCMLVLVLTATAETELGPLSPAGLTSYNSVLTVGWVAG